MIIMGILMSMEYLEGFFKPSSVAVIGASRDPTKVGHQLLRNLIVRFDGRVYAVNPNTNEILGVRVFPSVISLPEIVDLAVISVPAPLVPLVLEECGVKGIKRAVIISAGFKELGTPEGVSREELIVSIAKKYGIRVVGPNCMGIYVPKTGLNTTFLDPKRMDFPNHGNIAFISQSGAFGIAVLDWAAMRGVGISKFVSLGNKCDVDEADLIEYLLTDSDTQVITMYIEGVDNGRKFINSLMKVTPYKPVIILKSGRSEEGARAIASHTGSLAGSDVVYDTVFKQFGVIRALGMEELFDIAIAFSMQPPAAGNRVAILTVGGGSGVMATDAAVELGLKVPKLSDETVGKLKKVLLPIASPYNPIDVTGSARDEHLVEAIDILIRSGEVDGILWIPYFMAPGITEGLVKEFVSRLREVYSELGRLIPIVGAVTGGRYTLLKAYEAEGLGIPMLPSVERAAKALWALYRYGAWLRRCRTFNNYIDNFLKNIYLKYGH